FAKRTRRWRRPASSRGRSFGDQGTHAGAGRPPGSRALDRNSGAWRPVVRARETTAVMKPRVALGATVAVTLVGQVVALMYEVVVAATFGTGRSADALALALGLALMIANEVAGWVPILFQPEYIEARTTAGDTQADAF